jgi:hypothetical protein
VVVLEQDLILVENIFVASLGTGGEFSHFFVFEKGGFKLGVVVHACNCKTLELKAGGS